MNKAMVIGRLNGTVKFNDDKTACRFKMRVVERYQDKSYEEIINVYASSNNVADMAEFASGDMLLVKGMAKTGKYEFDGKTVYFFEIDGKEIRSIAESGGISQDGLDQNEVVLIGRLGGDPRVFNNGKVATFSMACEEYNGKKPDTQWINITTFNGLAKSAGDYLTKGRLVAVEGQIRTREYEKDGETRRATNIVARKWKALDPNPKRQNERSGYHDSGNYQSADDDIPF